MKYFLSGSLKNSFDKDKVQQEIDLQVKVSQSFNQNVQEANTEINKHLDDLKAKLDDPNISAAEKAEIAGKINNWQRGQVLINSIASGLTAPTQNAAGIVAATASPALSYKIGQEFKKLASQNEDGKLTASQETAHILAHAVLGAAVSAAGGNDALAGAMSAGGAEAVAPVIGKWLYGKDKGSDLTAQEKETVTAITSLLGAATGAAVGNSTANAAQGSLNAQSAVENNHAIRIIDKSKYIIIPTFGALYCSLDKQCTSATGTFMGMLDDLLEQDAKIEAENQKQLEEIKATFGEPWILSTNPSKPSDTSTNSKAHQAQNNVVQAATGSPQIEPPESNGSNGSKYKDKDEKVNDLLNSSTRKSNKNSLTQYDRHLTNQQSPWQQANKDFDSLNLQNVRTFQTKYGEGRIGNLPDGRVVNIRPGSSNGQTTVEIRNPSSSKVIKIRY